MKSGLALFSLVLLSSLGCFAQTQEAATPQTPPTASSTPVPITAASTTSVTTASDPKAVNPDSKKKKGEPPESKQDPAAAHKQQIVDLLDRSHAANDEVLPEQKATLLARQISMISRLNSESAEKWAQELFQLGEDQADDQKRARMQVMAIQMVAQGDPEFGLKLLHQVKPVAETDSTALVSANMISAATGAVFQGLARDKGESQLPRLRQEALRLAAESQYPYSAMGAVAIELLRDQRRGEPGSSEGQGSLMESVFDEAVANYERTVPTWSGNSDFGRMVQRLAYALPKEKVRHSLEVFVNNVQTTPSPSGVWMKVDSGAGATQMNDPVEVSLYPFMSLMNEFDPELMKQVVEAHPRLGQNAAIGAASSYGYGGSGYAGAGTGRAVDPNQMARLRAQGMASWNPDKALAMTQSITDPNMRAVTMGSVAERIAGDDSGRAMQLLDQAQKTAGDSQDLKTELQLVASRAEVAQATNNDAMVRDSLRKGFEIGDQLLRQEQDNNQGQVSWYMLGSLVQTGIKSDPDLTLAYINSFSLPYVRAELLMDAAQALRFGDSHGSRRRSVRTASISN
jgi:hypothetical protein